MKFAASFLIFFLSLPAFAEVDHLAKLDVPFKDLEGSKAQIGRLVVQLYKAEMAKPDSPLAKAMKPLLDDGNHVLDLDPTDIIFDGGAGGHNHDGAEEYTATYIFPLYYGYKSGTWPLVSLQIFTANTFDQHSAIYIEKLVDLEVKDHQGN